MPFNKNIYKSNFLVTEAKIGNCKEKAFKKIIETKKQNTFILTSLLRKINCPNANSNFNFISLNTKEV